MSDRVLLPLPDGRWLALSRETFETALVEGCAAVASAAAPRQADEPLLDADELAAALKLSVTWVEQAAREQKIPSVQAGRWRRFRRADVERALGSHPEGNGAGNRA